MWPDVHTWYSPDYLPHPISSRPFRPSFKLLHIHYFLSPNSCRLSVRYFTPLSLSLSLCCLPDTDTAGQQETDYWKACCPQCRCQCTVYSRIFYRFVVLKLVFVYTFSVCLLARLNCMLTLIGLWHVFSVITLLIMLIVAECWETFRHDTYNKVCAIY